MEYSDKWDNYPWVDFKNWLQSESTRVFIGQYTFSIQRGNNWVLRGTSLSIQRYRVRERKWQIRDTLARGVYGEYTTLHSMGKEKKETTRNIKGLL